MAASPPSACAHRGKHLRRIGCLRSGKRSCENRCEEHREPLAIRPSESPIASDLPPKGRSYTETNHQSISWSSASPTFLTEDELAAGAALRRAATLPSGTTTRVKPICAASRRRSAACVVPRIFARQPDFAEDRRARADRTVAQARRDGADDGEIGGGLVDRHPAGDVDEHVLAERG